MRIKLTFIFFIIVLGLTSLKFISYKMNKSKGYSEPIYCQYVDEVNETFIRNVYNKYDLIYQGGGGNFLKNVKLILLSFDKNIYCNIEDSRILLVNCIEEILARINSNNKLQPYLDHYPFTNKGVSISLSFARNNEKDNKTVAHIFNLNGKVYYSYYSFNEDRLKDLYQESYEEALRIVRDQGHLESAD